MLTAMAASAERLDPEVGFTDDDLDVILNLWDHEHRRKGGMPTVVGIERREADEAMHTGFGLGIPVGVFPLDEHGGALDARLFPRQDVENLRLKALALRPAQVHAQEHLDPVLRLGPASAGVNGENGVFLIIRAAKHAG